MRSSPHPFEHMFGRSLDLSSRGLDQDCHAENDVMQVHGLPDRSLYHSATEQGAILNWMLAETADARDRFPKPVVASSRVGQPSVAVYLRY